MEKKQKFDVHHYLIVRVKCSGVAAPDAVSAIKQTEQPVAEWASKYLVGEYEQRQFEYAEDTVAWLVDVEGDEEYLQSTTYERGDDGDIVPTEGEEQ